MPAPDARATIHRERDSLLRRYEAWLETPMLLLGLAWLVLLVLDLTRGLGPFLGHVSTAIWGVFIADFAVRVVLAPDKSRFLRRSWLTALSLALPALRVFRIARVWRVLRAARAARGLRLARVLTTVNRGMRALGASMGRRGFPYALALTAVVLLAGAAGMYASEAEAGGFRSYGEALWWTAMLLTSLGSEYWPQTAEGRLLCLLLGVYGFAVFGYVTATLATFFIGRDAANDHAEVAGAAAVAALRDEIAALRAELGTFRGPGAPKP